jgi:hypothetical protein
MRRKAGFRLISTLILFFVGGLNGQVSKEKPNSFYGKPLIGLLACQIDGDQASGYNKFGYQVGMATGFRLGKFSKLDALEMQFCLVERGSRRAFDPLTMVNAFNIKARQIEFQIGGIKDVDAGRFGELEILFGMRLTQLLKIEEIEGYNPGIADDFAKNGLLLQMAVGKKITSKVELRCNWDYSLISALSQKAVYHPFYPTGVYHNGLGVAALIRFNRS